MQGQARIHGRALRNWKDSLSIVHVTAGMLRHGWRVKPMVQRCISLTVLCGLPICVWLGLAGRADASAEIALLCDQAAALAAEETGVPAAILMAISRVETGRTLDGSLNPWPWTVNQAGDGSFFSSVNDAADHVSQAMDQGQTNIDIGCFQINMRWHGQAFSTLDDMFDPAQNALYAARFLRQLYDEHGGWVAAIGAYHSRQEDAATRYAAKVSALLEASLPDLPLVAEADSTNRENRYPLLTGAGGQRFGSLVATEFDVPPVPLFR